MGPRQGRGRQTYPRNLKTTSERINVAFSAKVRDIVLKGTRYNDVVLAMIVVSIIGLIIIRVPTWVLDTLLAVNLSIGATLLMISLYVPNVLAFSTFPSMLLFTTLFRLALNITATRLILLEAYAGEIIETFGQVVVAGNFIVGTVIFLIILIVQFLVITKGAERVSEVAARFTLDAMPGKQMSVDADLRAGVIDVEQARTKRKLLEKENQLYGAMDGAMKFVKGDAIASLIITAINIVAGIAIGVTQKGFTAVEAIQRYGILTIGDGLVASIPALLISITSGVIVTRVSSDTEKPLGQDIGEQMLGQPKALLIGGGLIIGLGLIPGFPKIQFGLLAIAVIALALSVGYKKKAPSKKGPPGIGADVGEVPALEGKEGKPTEEAFAITVPLMLDVSTTIQEAIDPEELNRNLIEIRKALYHDLGAPFPGIHLRLNDGLQKGNYRIMIQEVPVSEGTLKYKHLLVREDPENLDILAIPYTEESPFLPNIRSIWVEEKHKKKLENSKIPFMSTAQILSYHVSFILRKYSGEFVGIQETKFLLEKLEATFAEIVREVQRVLPIQKIAEVFQRLVQEDISIRNLRTLLQSLIDWGQKEKDPVLLTEYARSSLRRYISYKYSGGKNILAVYLVDPATEEIIRRAVRQTAGGNYLALDPQSAKNFVSAVKAEVGDLSKTQERPVLLTSMDIRRYVRKLIEAEMYELPVLSHQELTEEITIQPLGRIAI